MEKTKYRTISKWFSLTFLTHNNSESFFLNPGEIIEVEGGTIWWNGRESIDYVHAIIDGLRDGHLEKI
jgi:hypothetical protein